MVENRFEQCDGRALVAYWEINRHFFHTFEIGTDEAEAVIPDHLNIVEVRPGVALLSIGVLRYTTGHFGRADYPEFDEVVTAVHVSPDLSVDMPVPNMSFYSLFVYSNSPEFVEQDKRTIQTPAVYIPSLKVNYIDDFTVEMEDENGPIASLVNHHADLRFEQTELWGQHFTDAKALSQGIWEWDGRRSENMRVNKDWVLHDHPVFKGLKVSKIRKCYNQMLLEPGTLCRERFYDMKLI